MPDPKIVKTSFNGPLGERIVRLRYAVFVDEQNVPVEEEIDKYDEDAVHLAALDNDCVIGTLRIVALDRAARIGRLAVDKARRNNGIGLALMLAALEHTREAGFEQVILDAQVSATSFYEKLGFSAEGDVFDDCGIPHIRMVRAETKTS